MSWVRLDDGVLEHPKLVALDAMAVRVWLRVLCHASRHRTDGLVGDVVLARLGATPRIREQLTRAPLGYTHGLWEAVDGGIRVHDYREYQPTADGRARLSEARAEAGRRGGKASGERRRAEGATGSRGPDDEATTSPRHSDASPTQGARVVVKGPESLGGGEASCFEANEPRPVPIPIPNPVPPSPCSGTGVGEGTTTDERSGRAAPAIVNGSMLVDAWLDGMREAMGGRGWDRRSQGLTALRALQVTLATLAPKALDGGASWARSAALEYVRVHRGATFSTFTYQRWEESGRPAPRFPGAAPTEEDPAEKRRSDRRLLAEAEAKVNAVAAAQAKDDDQARRGRAASRRPTSAPLPIAPSTAVVAKAPRVELSAEEIERRRLKGLEDLAALQAEDEAKKVGGTP